MLDFKTDGQAFTPVVQRCGPACYAGRVWVETHNLLDKCVQLCYKKKPYSSLSNWNRAKNLGNSNHTRTKTLFIKHNNYLKNWDSCQEQVSFLK